MKEEYKYSSFYLYDACKKINWSNIYGVLIWDTPSPYLQINFYLDTRFKDHYWFFLYTVSDSYKIKFGKATYDSDGTTILTNDLLWSIS